MSQVSVEHTRRVWNRIVRLVAFGVLALFISLFPGGVWSGLLVANLVSTPAIPWSVILMGVVLWLIWQYLSGKGWPRSTAQARRNYLRANRLPRRVFGWAVLAGLLGIVALVGFWIVFFQLVKAPGNPLPDFSKYPPLTVVAVLVMAALVGGVAEEAGFRGYFQVVLQSELGGLAAILIAALVISPGHSLTQGFVWTTILFYLLVDLMFGLMAYLTDSILPGIVVHSLGLLAFFSLVWPSDNTRQLVREGGADIWFWIHVAQLIVFTILSVWAFKRLAEVTAATRVGQVEQLDA